LSLFFYIGASMIWIHVWLIWTGNDDAKMPRLGLLSIG